jgi:hypothetical protein
LFKTLLAAGLFWLARRRGTVEGPQREGAYRQHDLMVNPDGYVDPTVV